MIMNFEQKDWREINIGLYCVLVLSECISSRTRGSTWMFLVDNEESKYMYFFKWMWYNVTHVKSCFDTPIGSNVKQLNVKPCV
jgi:hypothetical protein